jgi:hypothetical protein
MDQLTTCDRQLHVIPTDDAVEHDTRYWNACICGPKVQAKQHHADGAMHWDVIVTHHALDGRP